MTSRITPLVALAVLAPTILAFASPSAAQSSEVLPAPATASGTAGPENDVPSDQVLGAARELAAIETESAAATALYVTGLVLHIGGIGGALAWELSRCSGTYLECRPNDPVVVGAMLGISGLGLVTLFVAIGLDVDSGVRRRAWRDAHHVTAGRGPEVWWSVAPTESGAALTAAGRF